MRIRFHIVRRHCISQWMRRALTLMADNYFAQGEYVEAVHWYEKTIDFIESTEVEFFYKESNGETLSSSQVITGNEAPRPYVNIIQGYIECKDFIRAMAYYQLAVKKWPYHDELFKLKRIMDSFIRAEGENEGIKSKIEAILQEKEHREQELKEKVNQFNEWAVSLLKLQGRCEEYLDFNSEEDWKVIERQMHEIAQKMLEDAGRTVSYRISMFSSVIDFAA